MASGSRLSSAPKPWGVLPKTRDDPHFILIRDQADRDAISSDLLRYRDGRSAYWADIIDMLSLDPEARQRVVLLLAEIDADSDW